MARLCGCCLNPANDNDPDIDLCSEGTGRFDGQAWKIRRCRVHAAAPRMLALLKESLERLQNMTTAEYQVGADGPIREKLEALIAEVENGR